jgi:membrane associated rhomboid family serine protease
MSLLPFATERPTQRLPLATCGLALVNLLVFIWFVFGQPDPYEIHQRYGFSPRAPQAWTLLTCLFFHTDLWHLLFNLCFLWLFGSAMEDALEWWLFLLTYFACSLAANLLYWSIAVVAQWDEPTVGASGAIAGLLGTFAVRFYPARLRLGKFQMSYLWLIGFFVCKELCGGVRDLTVSAAPTAGHWAHLGGFGLGMLYGLLAKLHAEGRTQHLLHQARAAASQGQWVQAIELAGKVAQQEPDNVDAHLLLARSYDVMRQAQRSQEHFQQAIRTSWKKDDRLQASRIYLETVRAHPTFCLEPREQLSLVPDFLQAQEFEHAISVLAKIVAYYPETLEAETALLRAGQIYLERLNEPERALEMFELLLARYPHTVWRTQADMAAATARAKLASDRRAG